METGEYLIGTNPDKSKTGQGNVVRLIKVKSIKKAEEEHEDDEEVELFYAMSFNKNKKGFQVFFVEENDFEKPGYKNEKVDEFQAKEKNEEKEQREHGERGEVHRSYLGYDFGEVIPEKVTGYKALIEDIVDVSDEEEIEKGHLVFIGMEEDEDENEMIRLCWVLKEDDGEGHQMEETVIERQEFVKNMLIPIDGETKKMTIHYINTNGEKTKMSVNSESEIKDMKEELYRMDN